MRRTWRTAMTALAGGAAVAAAVLPLTPAQAATPGPASTAGLTRTAGPSPAAGPATAVPPVPSSALAGTWVNTDHTTRNIVDLVVAATAKGVKVDGFGACSPAACQWGRIAATVFGASAGARTGTSFAAQWNFGFSRTVIVASYATPKDTPTLTVREFTTFTDHTKRSNYVATQTFTKGSPVKVTKTGTAAMTYPVGDSVGPVAALPGIWVNNAAGGNVRAVILTRGAGGDLRVQAYGYCAPVPCNWGSVAGIGFAPGVSGTTARTFLAPYKVSFAGKLLDGTLNAAGTGLTLRTLTEFTDHSGRSSYVTTEHLVPLH